LFRMSTKKKPRVIKVNKKLSSHKRKQKYFTTLKRSLSTGFQVILVKFRKLLTNGWFEFRPVDELELHFYIFNSYDISGILQLVMLLCHIMTLEQLSPAMKTNVLANIPAHKRE